jgi:hypothetical protein
VRKAWQVIAVAVVGLCLGLAIVGCGSSTPTGKDKMGDKMGGDKMDGGKMGGQMDGGKMGDKMDGGKMADEKKDRM